MRTVTAQRLLDVWEQGATSGTLARAALLLSVCGQGEPDSVEQLPIGRRDALLLELRARLFGPEISCVADCPSCSEVLELRLPVAGLLAGAPSEATDRGRVEIDGTAVEFRLPNSADLAAIADVPDAVDARRRLFDRCLLATPWPADDRTIGMVAAEMSRLDPHADIQIALDCPSCRHHWTSALDILPILWAEVTVWAHRTLRQVHTLASAYGWTEREVLGLSARRRELYIDLVSG
jgi:hypothetical protein